MSRNVLSLTHRNKITLDETRANFDIAAVELDMKYGPGTSQEAQKSCVAIDSACVTCYIREIHDCEAHERAHAEHVDVPSDGDDDAPAQCRNLSAADKKKIAMASDVMSIRDSVAE